MRDSLGCMPKSACTVAFIWFASLSRPCSAQVATSALPAWATTSDAYISRDSAVVSGVSLGLREDQLRNILGQPDSVVHGYSGMIDSTVELYFRTAYALLSPNGVENFECWGKGCQQKSGVGVGSTVREVVNKLGRGFPGYGPDSSYSLIYYVQGRDSWLEFLFDKELRVRRVSLANDNS